MKLETIELKFLLKLLGQPGYRGAMSQLTPGKSASERDKACRSLGRQGLVEYQEDVSAFSIQPSGQGLLKLDTSTLPISEQELHVLQVSKGRTTPGQLKKVPGGERQDVIQNLVGKGFLKANQIRMKEAWLTPKGDAFLRDEYIPKGGATISLNLLASYISFLRHSPLRERAAAPTVVAESSSRTVLDNITTAQLLAAIAKLDAQYNTANYLPLYYLREALPLSRQAMDQMLYDLQSQDEIELDTLQEVQDYTDAQLKSGIPQPVGGPLFFVSLPE